ncbi:hypothetical protein GCM10007391_31010 [Alteromonas halophila]|uniref:TIGR04255 family protein n=2 Tax=Alteromonas halophila TaxID=516698 RepID=A0A918JPD6_9ALTE|nr:hypothetical protein GCM10007391_31010 [Alteromonas halophila]
MDETGKSIFYAITHGKGKQAIFFPAWRSIRALLPSNHKGDKARVYTPVCPVSLSISETTELISEKVNPGSSASQEPKSQKLIGTKKKTNLVRANEKNQVTEFRSIGPRFGIMGIALQERSAHKVEPEMSNSFYLTDKFNELLIEYNSKLKEMNFRVRDIEYEQATYDFFNLAPFPIGKMDTNDLGNGWRLSESIVIDQIIYAFEASKVYDTSSLDAVKNAIINKFGSPNFETDSKLVYAEEMSQSQIDYNSMKLPVEAEISAPTRKNSQLADKLEYFIEFRMHVKNGSNSSEKVELIVDARAPRAALEAIQLLDKRFDDYITSVFEEGYEKLRNEANTEISL